MSHLLFHEATRTELRARAPDTLVPTKFSVSGLEPERAAEIAAWAVVQRFQTIRVKGGIEPESDMARVRR